MSPKLSDADVASLAVRLLPYLGARPAEASLKPAMPQAQATVAPTHTPPPYTGIATIVTAGGMMVCDGSGHILTKEEAHTLNVWNKKRMRTPTHTLTLPIKVATPIQKPAEKATVPPVKATTVSRDDALRQALTAYGYKPEECELAVTTANEDAVKRGK